MALQTLPAGIDILAQYKLGLSLTQTYTTSPMFNLVRYIVENSQQTLSRRIQNTAVQHDQPSACESRPAQPGLVHPSEESSNLNILGRRLRLLLANLTQATHKLVSGGHADILEHTVESLHCVCVQLSQCDAVLALNHAGTCCSLVTPYSVSNVH